MRGNSHCMSMKYAPVIFFSTYISCDFISSIPFGNHSESTEHFILNCTAFTRCGTIIKYLPFIGFACSVSLSRYPLPLFFSLRTSALTVCNSDDSVRLAFLCWADTSAALLYSCFFILLGWLVGAETRMAHTHSAGLAKSYCGFTVEEAE